MPVQPNPEQPQLSKSQQQDLMKKMEEEHEVWFRFKELIAIYNILTKLEFRYGDSLVVNPIIEKLAKLVAVDSNIPMNVTKRAEEAEKMVGIN